MLLMIDNYDSFTYNLVQYLGELGEDVRVYRNDQISVAEIEKLNRTTSSSRRAVHAERGRRVGGDDPETRRKISNPWRLSRAPEHRSGLWRKDHTGQTTDAWQDLDDSSCRIGCVFRLPNPFEATRYHSLVIERSSLPWFWKSPPGPTTARSWRAHKSLQVEGVQFHPESILTQHGHELLANFLKGQRRAA